MGSREIEAVLRFDCALDLRIILLAQITPLAPGDRNTEALAHITTRTYVLNIQHSTVP